MSFTVLTAEFSHESNTFSRVPTDHKAFADRFLLRGEDAVLQRGNANTSLAGFRDVGLAEGWLMPHVLSTSAPPAGPVTRDAFDLIAAEIVAAARARRAFLDGIALGLHGAMVTTFDEDGEGELLERLRSAVGPDLPIALTLDPHANVTVRMCALAQIIVSYKTYPHVDMRDCGQHAARILHRTMSGEIRPLTLRVHRPMLEEVNGGRTDTGPMIARLALARAHEQRDDVFAVSINAGFGNADIAEVGPTILVTADGDMTEHQAFANRLADDIWQRRFETINHYLTVEEAARRCVAHDGAARPLVVADYADNPGGGAPGDGTNLLGAMLAAGVGQCHPGRVCLGPMVDPEAVANLQGHAVGDVVSLALGGRTEPDMGGGPLAVTGTIHWLGEGSYRGDGPMIGGQALSFGPVAVVRIAGIDVLVVSLSSQMLDLQQFRAFGIDPAEMAVVALKSMQHFRAAFGPIAAEIIVCDSGALCTPDLTKLTYRRVPRPIHPLDHMPEDAGG
jgi:microcystin degradation protein MlrC